MKTVTVKEVKIEKVCRNAATQARERIDPAIVEDYAAAMRRGDVFPPILLFGDGEKYFIGDGHHRFDAAVVAEWLTVRAEVRPGGEREALLYAVGANDAHGLRRTNADKRRAVALLLADAEWGKLSDRKIARLCRVTHPFVAQVRRSASGNGYHPSLLYTERAARIGLRVRETRRAAERCSRASLNHAIEAGRALAEAKALVPAGKWLAWLDKNFDGGRQIAKEYIRLYQGRNVLEGAEEGANAFLASVLAQISMEGQP